MGVAALTIEEEHRWSPRGATSRPLARAALIVLVAATVTRGDGPPPARLVPAGGLVAYLEYDGLDAHETAWKGSAAYAMIHGTPAGAMVADVARQSVDRMLKGVAGATLTGGDVVALHDHLFRNGFALALYGDDLDATVIVVRGLGRKEARERFDRALRLGLGAEGFAALKPTKVRGRDVYRGETPRPVPARLEDSCPPRLRARCPRWHRHPRRRGPGRAGRRRAGPLAGDRQARGRRARAGRRGERPGPARACPVPSPSRRRPARSPGAGRARGRREAGQGGADDGQRVVVSKGTT